MRTAWYWLEKHQLFLVIGLFSLFCANELWFQIPPQDNIFKFLLKITWLLQWSFQISNEVRFIFNWSSHYKSGQDFYESGQLLQIEPDLFQIGAIITNRYAAILINDFLRLRRWKNISLNQVRIRVVFVKIWYLIKQFFWFVKYDFLKTIIESSSSVKEG